MPVLFNKAKDKHRRKVNKMLRRCCTLFQEKQFSYYVRKDGIMTGLDLGYECGKNDGCADCAVRPECNKFQKKMSALPNIYIPENLNKLIDLLIDLLHDEL